MKVLVIGNGFDIEHGLRTKYPQFIEFVEWINSVDTEPGKVDINNEDELIYKRLIIQNPEIISELKSYVEDNLWIKYFETLKELNENTWIDFESEIASIVKLFDKGRKQYLDKVDFYTDIVGPSKEFKKFYKVFFGKDNISDIKGVAFDNYKNKMLKDLQDLKRALEIYIEYWVDRVPIKCMNPDLARIHPNKVISFNYTHTFERVYGRNVYGTENCYIHGEAKGKSLDDNNMVLGIDDYSDNENDDGFLFGFKKYYQRLDFNTDNSYKKWIEEIKINKNESCEIYIFGHSLDVTDKEVFEPLLSIENAKTVVFCYDKKSRSKLIANVIKLIGKKITEEKVASGKLSFVLQAKSVEIENSELEIWADIHDVYDIKKLNFDKIDSLLNKVRQRIEDQDTRYFNDLRFVISMVDALASNNLYAIIDEEKLFSIIKELYSLKKYEGYFNHEEWVDYSYDGQVFYRPETEKVIGIINEYIHNSCMEMEDCFEKKFNKTNIKESDMKCDNYLNIFENVFKYLCEIRKFDEREIRYLSHLLSGNSKEAYKSVQKLGEQIGNNNIYQSPYGEIFLKVVEGLIEEICYEEYLSSFETSYEQ